jgi:hypothetical protein
LGRFTQADILIPNPYLTVTFDRFAYSYNNPIRFSDPSGYDPCEGIEGQYLPFCREKQTLEESGITFEGEFPDLASINLFIAGYNFSKNTVGNDKIFSRDIGLDIENGLTIENRQDTTKCVDNKGFQSPGCYQGDTNKIYINWNKITSPSHLIETLTNEIGHVIDYHAGIRRQYGTFASSIEFVAFIQGWDKSNDVGFVYTGNNDREMGYVSNYALESPMEDFAETFVWFVDQKYNIIPERYDKYWWDRPSLDRQLIVFLAIYGY